MDENLTHGSDFVNLEWAGKFLRANYRMSAEEFAELHKIKCYGSYLGGAKLFLRSELVACREREAAEKIATEGKILTAENAPGPSKQRGWALPINRIARIEIKVDALILALTKQLGLTINLSEIEKYR